jgi:predicted component of type VI protein secretion system
MTATACIRNSTRVHTLPARASAARPSLALGGDTYLPIERAVTHIGRGFHADVQLDDHSVSHRHAVLVDTAAGMVLLDDTSTNGTFLNGRRTTRALLAPGDEITLGRVTLRYAAAAGPAPQSITTIANVATPSRTPSTANAATTRSSGPT